MSSEQKDENSVAASKALIEHKTSSSSNLTRGQSTDDMRIGEGIKPSPPMGDRLTMRPSGGIIESQQCRFRSKRPLTMDKRKTQDIVDVPRVYKGIKDSFKVRAAITTEIFGAPRAAGLKGRKDLSSSDDDDESV